MRPRTTAEALEELRGCYAAMDLPALQREAELLAADVKTSGGRDPYMLQQQAVLEQEITRRTGGVP